MRRRLMIIAGITLTSSPALAHDEVQLWPSVMVSAPVSGVWRASGEVINRVVSDSDRPSQLEARLQLGRPITRRLTLSAGYVHVVTYNPLARTGVENQIVEQVNWDIGTMYGVRLTTRMRLEQRFQRGSDGVNWRVRQQLRGAMPIARTATAVVWAEPFVSINRTNLVRQTFEQLRLFAGVGIPVGKHVNVEFGYLRQDLYRPTGNIHNDTIPLIFNVAF